MPIFTRTFQIIAGVLAVPVIGTAIIATNYQSPFLTHLVDIVEGGNTTTEMSANAPNWGYGVPLPTVVGVSAATSTGGTIASSTTYTFAVSALDQTGTTTISTPVSITSDFGITTDNFQIKWNPVPGAQGYAIFFATGTPAVLDQYFIATSSSAYNFSTSTGSLTGPYTKLDTTAFADLINPSGPSYLEAANGTATSSIATSTALELNGALRTTEIGTSTSCDPQTAGAMFFNTKNKHMWGCDGSNWNKIY